MFIQLKNIDKYDLDLEIAVSIYNYFPGAKFVYLFPTPRSLMPGW